MSCSRAQHVSELKPPAPSASGSFSVAPPLRAAAVLYNIAGTQNSPQIKLSRLECRASVARCLAPWVTQTWCLASAAIGSSRLVSAPLVRSSLPRLRQYSHFSPKRTRRQLLTTRPLGRKCPRRQLVELCVGRHPLYVPCSPATVRLHQHMCMHHVTHAPCSTSVSSRRASFDFAFDLDPVPILSPLSRSHIATELACPLAQPSHNHILRSGSSPAAIRGLPCTSRSSSA